jgi:hemerythrin-like domain-containing protein
MPSATQMLREDHAKVKELFQQFETAGSDAEKKRIAEAALRELVVHAAVEEELFYPALREHLDPKQVDLAQEEHHVAELLIKELDGLRDPAKLEAKFKVLAESVKHHIQEEESELLPEAESSLDDESLGEEMATRKEDLEKKLKGGLSGLIGMTARRKAASTTRRAAGRTGGGRAVKGRKRRAG